MKGGIGICLLLVGVSMLDSKKMLIPIIMCVLGAVLLLLEGRKSEKPKVHDYTSHSADYPSYLWKR